MTARGDRLLGLGWACTALMSGVRSRVAALIDWGSEYFWESRGA